MRLHRFYVNFPLGEEVVVENVDGEKELIHQWAHVFRYTSGDEVFLFSSLQPGSDFLYRISELSKQKVILSPVSSTPNILPAPCTLVMALVKKDTFETIARQATELGVTRIIPLEASRSEKKNLNFDRLIAIVTEASEQSGRGAIPEITPIATFQEALELTAGTVNILGSLHGQSSLPAKENKELALWVGPEGGWTDDEESLCIEKGHFSIKLTSTTLKADTAAVSLLTLACVSPQ